MRSYIVIVDYCSSMDGMVLVSDSGNGGVPVAGPGLYLVSSKYPFGVLHYLSVAIAQENECNGGPEVNGKTRHVYIFGIIVVFKLGKF